MPQNFIANNSIGLLRYLLACVVIVHHANVLLDRQYPLPLGADIAVYTFFFLSGFFVLGSYGRSSSPGKFVLHRLQRLLPSYWAVVLASAFGLSIVSSLSYPDYFTSVEWVKYLVANMCLLNFLAPDLPGVFTGHLMTAVNGSLWYVKLEVLFTFLFPILLWGIRNFESLLKTRRSLMVPVGGLIWAGLGVGLGVFLQTGLLTSLTIMRYVHCFQMFLAGILFSALFPLLKSWRHFAGLLLGLSALMGILAVSEGTWDAPSVQFVEATLLVVLLFRVFWTDSPLSVLNRSNLSYSLYLCHFPVIQLSQDFFPGFLTFPMGIILIVAVTLLLYYGVERRFTNQRKASPAHFKN